MSRMRRWFAFPLLLLLLVPGVARAHVGSKDVFEEAAAGPYKLFVTVRTPVVIPGVATVEVRTSGAPVDGITLTQLPLTGEAAQNAPTPDAMKRSEADPKFFTGNVWVMQAGSMQVRFEVSGSGGSHTAAVPVPAQPLKTLPMQRTLGISLAVCGLVLIFGLGGILAAAVREARLKPGLEPTPELRRRGWLTAVITVLVAFGLVWGGNLWWKVEAADFAGTIYKPLAVTPTLAGDHLQLLVGAHTSNHAGVSRGNNDFILDHGKIMHLYAVREPELDQVYHLHPALAGPGDFELDLPKMPPGEYRLYGDVVHANGFPETLVSTITVPAGMAGRALEADDASGSPAPMTAGELGATYKLPDGYTMVWAKPATLTANTAYAFHFTLLDPAGKAPAHMRPYLGMAGHAAFLKADGAVFAHVHPEGSAAMAAMMIANGGGSSTGMAPDTAGMSDMAGMAAMPGMIAMPGMGAASSGREVDLTSNAVEFPYGFPSAGRYRIFIQMKHDGLVETGTFDAVVQ